MKTLYNVRKWIRRSFTAALIVSIIISSIGITAAHPVYADSSSGELASNMVEVPPITPKPQTLQVTGNGFVIGADVALITGAGTKQDTVDSLKVHLQSIGVTNIAVGMDDQEPEPQSPVLIYVGGPSENAASEAQLQLLGSEWPNMLNDEGYVLASGYDGVVGQNKIVLAGQTPKGTFYALQSFKQLTVRSDSGYAFPSVQITDWPTMAYRGVVEGFYGKPWSHQDRMSLLDFYGTHKLNTYIYAPKDDAYHREKWREPYPAADYERLRELVQKANQNRVDFVFAISPGGDMVFSSDGDFGLLVQKAQAAWDLGVRSFAIYMDDIDPNLRHQADKDKFGNDINPSAAAQTYVLNKFNQEFIKTHNGAKRLITVPTDYFGLTETPYISRFAELLDADILVHWTGKGVFADTVTTTEADIARAFYKHDILFWDNFPVNDTSRDKLYLAPLQGRDGKLYEHGIAGFVSNPSEDAELSKLAIYNYGDYTWNPDEYNYEQSWQQSLQWMGGELYEALKTVAENNYSTPVTPNNESLTIKPLIDQFWQQYDSGQDIHQAADRLHAEIIKLQKAIYTVQHEMGNPKFVQEINTHLVKLDLQTKVASEAILMLVAQKNNYSQSVIIEHRTNLMKHYDLANNMPQVRNNQPLYDFINRAIAENDKLWERETPLPRETLSSLVTYQDYSIDRMVDNNPATFYWAHGQVHGMDVGEFFGIDLKEIKTIHGVQVVMDAGDYLNAADIEISLDGVKWIKVGSSYGKSAIQMSLNNYNARYVRVVAAARNDKWVKVFDFNVGLSRSDVNVTTNLSYDQFVPANIVDNNPNTYFWSGQSPKAGDEIRLNFTDPNTINHIALLMDYMYNVKKGVVEYTTDGAAWNKLFDLNGEGYKIVSFPEITAKALRIRITENQPVWLMVGELMFSKSDASDQGFPTLVLDREALSLTKGASQPLKLSASYADGTTRDVTGEATFVSTNPTVAGVTAQGTVTGTVFGVSEIIVAYQGQYKVAKVAVVPESGGEAVTNLALDSKAYTLKIKQTHATVVEAVYANGDRRTVTQDAVYVSSDPAVASVNAAGEVLGVTPGITTVTVTYGAFAEHIQVKVIADDGQEPAMERIQFQTPSVELKTGQYHQSVVQAVYTNGEIVQINESVQFRSTHPNIASVDSQGIIRGLTTGTASIIASYNGLEAVAQVIVNQADNTSPGGNPVGGGSLNIPVKVTGIELTAKNASMKAGEKQQLSVRAKYSDGTAATVSSRVIYTSSDVLVAAVDRQGLVKANAAGRAIMTAYYDTYSASVTLTVTKEEDDPSSRTIEAGKGAVLKIGEEFIVQVSELTFARPVALSLSKIETPESLLKLGKLLISSVFKVTMDGNQKPAKAINLQFTIDVEKGHGKKMALYRYDEQTQQWVKLQSQYDQGRVTAQTEAAGMFALLSEEAPQPVDFNDMAGHWADNVVRKAVELGFVQGFEDGSFKPNAPVTRGEFATMLGRALKSNAEEAQLSFSDATQIPAWARSYVAAAVQEGWITGYSDKSFRAGQPISRQEMAAMIVRASGETVDPDAALPFTDEGGIAGWAKPFVAKASQLGWVQGKGGGAFAPADKATRAEAVKVILALLQHQDDVNGG